MVDWIDAKKRLPKWVAFFIAKPCLQRRGNLYDTVLSGVANHI